MKLGFDQGLIGVGIAVPVILLAIGLPAWAAGIFFGELAGLISFVWVGLSVRRAFSSDAPSVRRSFFFQSLIRYVVLGMLFVLAIQWPAVEIIGVFIGYTLVQLPASIIRALSDK